MATEREVKQGKALPICSVSGRRCHCGSTGRCESRLGDGRLDEVSEATLRWARTAALYLDAVKDHVHEAQTHIPRGRQYPAAELREVVRLLDAAQSALNAIGEK